MATKKSEPIHPGEILLAEFLEPLGISQYRLAKDWLNLQSHYDLEVERERLGNSLQLEMHVLAESN